MEELKNALIDLVVSLLGFMLIGCIVSPTYNAIAWEFNLPTLNYWIICGAMYTINKIRVGVPTKKEK